MAEAASRPSPLAAASDAGDAGEARPTVAHFRHTWFAPTETFLHTTISACRATRPLLVGYARGDATAFPHEGPAVFLYPTGSWRERVVRLRQRLLGPRGHTRFERRATFEALREAEASVLHAHFGDTGVALLGIRRRTALPLVTTFYGHDASARSDDPVWRAELAELFAEGTLFLVEGPHLRRRLVELGCPADKVAIQRIAIRTRRYPFRQRRPKPRGEPVRLFFCARFREKKGLAYALEALACARARHPDVVLRVAGDGPLRADVESRIARLGLAPHVQLINMISQAQMLEEMDAADLFVQPSVTATNGDSEGGAPTTVLEAQACGLPVLTTRHADIPYVVREGESALLSAERDVEGLARNLLALVREPERWATMGAAGRAHVERFHEAEREVVPLEARYLALARCGGASFANR